MLFLIWNVRGLNRVEMHAKIKNKISSLKLSFVGLLETRVIPDSLAYIWNCVLPNGWKDYASMNLYPSTRIWILWNL